eukprot:CAMPEP_0119117158 /NCGR_PEP_ID=MMETSP1180-20130426/52684_1 /TAXON_ID=3052 ORGANISM="Chlamydomonas cf sp, Strain CCMP681" /NCGR_SAMPLE_ID=MMETSP1180 /ASSEMBLY_ACC=CAM_ASM_000741 /LENGTH=67 /DNA_ID=CAMNT_0007106381 /DNA_START=1074 /DNA_END=1273 /DNA_ORIENTATION=+
MAKGFTTSNAHNAFDQPAEPWLWHKASSSAIACTSDDKARRSSQARPSWLPSHALSDLTHGVTASRT